MRLALAIFGNIYGTNRCNCSNTWMLRVAALLAAGLVVILLGGGTKVRQQNDIAIAKERWADYKRRKKGQD